MGAEKTFADYKGTARRELQMMLEMGGVRKGDTLVIRALSDLGQGRESQRLQKIISDLGVVLKVVGGGEAPRLRGRKARLTPTAEQKEHICALWYSPATVGHVLDRASEIVGGKVDRNNMNYWCGSRSGPPKK